MKAEAYYRVDDGDCYEYSGWQPPILQRFPVVKKTPRGVWVNAWGVRKFILNGARKRFAYPTKEEAVESYKIRKNREIGHANSRIQKVEEMLAFIADGQLRELQT